jgi:hypothetical protein
MSYPTEKNLFGLNLNNINNNIKNFKTLWNSEAILHKYLINKKDIYLIKYYKQTKSKYYDYWENILLKYFKDLKIYNIDSVLIKFLRKKVRYIKYINKEVSKWEIADYKIKLLINFFKEKTNFWIFIENFNIKLDLLEIFLILVRLILKILGLN